MLEAACRLCACQCPQERALGANILGQLGVPDRTFPQEAGKTLRDLLGVETNEDVLDAACIALGHTPDPTATPSLVRLKTHPSTRLRFAVAFALADLEDELAIKTKIEMTRDGDPSVRDWATFRAGRHRR